MTTMTTSPTSMTAAEVLRRAADYIEEHGWRQQVLGCNGGPRCAVGAMCSAVGKSGIPLSGDCPEMFAAWDALQASLDAFSIAQWNDHRDRTATEVISTLRRVADELEAGR